MFKAVSTDIRFPEQEQQVLQFWKDNKIYAKSLEQRADSPSFVFYEGPPTANGMPHPGHCLTRAIKDLFPRYRTMRGYRCERKAGWDTHGLPVEVEVCKELGIHGKDEIEKYGIEPFIQKCQQSVWRYMQEWERLTERIGFWIDLSQAYVTYHQSYVESVWWSLKNLFDRGLLYRGHKIVWWWAQGGTALSAGEVGQGYRQVADPSVFVKFPLVDEPNTSLVIWTTTPWTLPSNMFAAVHPDIEYAYCSDEESGEQLIVAAALVTPLSEKMKRSWTVTRTVKGSELVGKHYQPPMDYYSRSLAGKVGKLSDASGKTQKIYWRIVAANFVTLDSGSGMVHIAPAFGEVDYELMNDEQKRFETKIELLCAVGPDGKFTEVVREHQGVWVKDADKAIIRQLKESGRLLFLDQYLHDYPFCWRAEQDPLIQYPRESWFIRTTQFRDKMLENNSKIGWLPENIRDGRFGNFLQSNVDWALSRERYWGTPLPIWVCESTGKMESIGSYDELLKKPGIRGTEMWTEAKKANPELVEDLKVHKPYIDAVTYDSPFVPGARMQRVTEVIDCWYDSGAMPFAQWGYPHTGKEQFADQFPADFISEAIDQTRGWFYSQLAISTMLFGSDPSGSVAKSDTAQVDFPHPFRNCIVLGLMLAEWYESKDGKQRFLTEEEAKQVLGADYVSKTGKMSKSLRNYRSPNEIFDKYGADALRWYFFANQAPWNSIIYSERAIRDSIPEFMLRIWNVVSFFSIYAEIDKFAGPGEITGDLDQLDATELARAVTYRDVNDRSEIDRWILSELAITVDDVVQRMDRYDSFGACQQLNALVDGLSNWYVRRCRNRYWGKETAQESQDKADAYWTLYEVLLTTSKLIAPYVPFLAETIWKTLTEPVRGRVRESVHLCDYPNPSQPGEHDRRDLPLGRRMLVLREIASLGRSARMDSKLKVRQPLSRVEVSLASDEHIGWLREHDAIVREELNVKEIAYNAGNSPFIEYKILPDLKRLGPRIGKLLPKLKAALGSADGAKLLSELQISGKITLDLDGTELQLDNEDIQVRLQAKTGWTAAQGKQCVVVLSTDLTPQLIREGYARDLVRLVQDNRKQMQCQFTDRIRVYLVCSNPDLIVAFKENLDYIMTETLAVEIVFDMPTSNVEMNTFEIGEHTIQLGIEVI